MEVGSRKRYSAEMTAATEEIEDEAPGEERHGKDSFVSPPSKRQQTHAGQSRGRSEAVH